MSNINKTLLVLFVFLLLIASAELIYFFMLSQRKENHAIQSSVTPSFLPSSPTISQEKISQDSKLRLTKFLESILGELSDNTITNSVNIKTSTNYKGKINTVYQGKEVEKFYPSDPNDPKKTVAIIIDLGQSGNNHRIIITMNELTHLTITDENNKELKLNDIKNKQVSYNHIIDLQVSQSGEVIINDPIVYNQIIVLN